MTRALIATLGLLLLGAPPAFAQSLEYDINGELPQLGRYTGVLKLTRAAPDPGALPGSSVAHVRLSGTLTSATRGDAALTGRVDTDLKEGIVFIRAPFLPQRILAEVKLNLDPLVPGRLEGTFDTHAFTGTARPVTPTPPPTVVRHSFNVRGTLPVVGAYTGVLTINEPKTTASGRVSKVTGVLDANGRSLVVSGELNNRQVGRMSRLTGSLVVRRYENVVQGIIHRLPGPGVVRAPGRWPRSVTTQLWMGPRRLFGRLDRRFLRGTRIGPPAPTQTAYQVAGYHAALGHYTGNVIVERTPTETRIRGDLRTSDGRPLQASGSVQDDQGRLRGRLRFTHLGNELLNAPVDLETGAEWLNGTVDGARIEGIGIPLP